MRRKRCPICRRLETNLVGHIQNWHYPTHCTVCDKTPESHEQTKSSPHLTFPCAGGIFTWEPTARRPA